MTGELKKGDRVEWNTTRGKTEGRVLKKLTEPIEIEEHHAKASRDEPQFLVQSEKSGKKAAHKPEALHKKPS